jgi:acyl transferase domain-containing protein/phosphopantetheinyl transferase (holo-ACP synthase)
MSAATDPGVAIIGMSCLFPGAPDLDAYWRNILAGVDATSEPPPEAWDQDSYYDPEFADRDKTYCRRGGYLGSLVSFAPLEYGIPPVAVGGEPDQWLALQLAHDALADAGLEDLPAEIRSRTGVMLGKGTYLNGGNAAAIQRGLIVEQTIQLLARLHPEHTPDELARLRHELQGALPAIGPETVPGLVPNIIVGRIANRLDLMGPTYTVDAACASSLVAVEHAITHLRDGTCDLALTGGAQVWMPVPVLNIFCQLGALSRREVIAPFDADADGTLLGEGIGMLVLKRQEDAERDGDRVYAVIRGVGVASDGRGASVMAPRVAGEVLALRRAYEKAGVDPATIGLIEAHGTATPVGDATEIEALTEVFGARDGGLPKCALGTVKSMISHTIPASGVAGMIKLALALHHRVLPPTLNVRRPNPKLGLERTPFYLNTQTRPWIHGGSAPRRAGINAFGFGGINAHAILEQAPADERVAAAHLPAWDSELCALEANSVEGLIRAAEDLSGRLAAAGDAWRLGDVSASLCARLGTVPTPLRLAIVATSLEDLRAKLDKAVERLRKPGTARIKATSGTYFAAEPLGRRGGVTLVFPGEGSQYPGMLADLCVHFPAVREAFDLVDRIYRGRASGDVPSDWIFPRPTFEDAERRAAEERLMDMDVAVAAVLGANHAMHALLDTLGVRYDGCLGHSTGDYSALAAAGVLDLEDDERRAEWSAALYDCYARAASTEGLPRATLLAVAADRGQVETIAGEAGGELYIGMDNCPHQTVLVGEPEAAERARELLNRDAIIHEPLPYDRAVHTPRFAAFADALREMFAASDVRTPRTPLYSCTTGERYPDDPAEIRELLVRHWLAPVEFRRTIAARHAAGDRVFIECGARGNLSAFIEDTLRGEEFCAVAVDTQRRSGLTQLNHLVAQLLAHDVAVDASALHVGRDTHVIDLDAPESAAPAEEPLRIPLTSGWPMLRLDDEAVAEVRGGRADIFAPGPAGGVAGEDEPLDDWPAEELLDGDLVLDLDEPFARPAARDAFEDAEQAISDHLATMEQFLSAEAEIMQAYLAPDDAASPLGAVVARTADELIALRTFDPGAETALDDHRLGGTLVVVPLALSLALLAEAAAELVDGLVVVGLRDVRAHRWIAIEEGPATVEISARRLPDDGDRACVRVQARVVDPPPTAELPPEVEATVLLAAEHPPAPMAMVPPAGGEPSRLAPERLYGEAMFHGPSWRAVAAIDSTGPHGVRARLRVLPRPPMEIDPVVLDAAGQLVGFWTAERLTRGRVVFPFRLAELELFAASRPVDESLTGIAEIELVGDQLTRANVDVLDADGRPWMRLTGWEDKRFDLPPALESLLLAGPEATLSTTWPAPIAAELSGGQAMQCRIIPVPGSTDADLWARVWAARVLSAAERHELAARRLPPARRMAWLAARTAGKEALADLLLTHHGRRVDIREIELLADDRGRPVAGGPALVGLAEPPGVSLAHRGEHAIALVALRGAPGIDLEIAGPRPERFNDVAFAEAERALIAALDDEWALRCFCAKEAAGKALGTGLPGGPRDMTVTAVDPAERLVTVHATASGGPELSVRCTQEDDVIVATTLIEKGAPR